MTDAPGYSPARTVPPFAGESTGESPVKRRRSFAALPAWPSCPRGEKCVRLARNCRLAHELCIRLARNYAGWPMPCCGNTANEAEVGPSAGPTWCLSRSGAAAKAQRTAGRSAAARFGASRSCGGCFCVCCLYSVNVIKSAKGAYLEISSSSKH